MPETPNKPKRIIGHQDFEMAMAMQACIAVLKCPMSVEDKINTLQSRLGKYLQNGYEVTAFISDVAPFNIANEKYAHFLATANEIFQDMKGEVI